MATIRPAVSSDLKPLAGLLNEYRQFYKQPSDIDAAHEFLEQRMGLADSYILVSEEGDSSLTGFVQMYPGVSTVGLNARWTLNDLFVLPQCRTQGTGKALMQAAQQLAYDHGVARLILMTQVENYRAQKLYEDCGWQRNSAFYSYLIDIK